MEKNPNQFSLMVQAAVVSALAVNLIFSTGIWLGLGRPGLFGLGGQTKPKSAAKQNFEVIAIVDSTCENCSRLDEILKFVKESDVEIAKESQIDYGKEKDTAQTIIDKYKITKIPTLVIIGPRPQDKEFGQFWDTFGEVVGGDFVLRKVQPPYREISSGETRGLFRVTFLTDKSCAACYDAKVHVNAFERISMKVINSRGLDVKSAEGGELIKKYGIKLVPTILVDGDLAEYEGFQTVWPYVGTAEEDGTYVFRDGVKQMGTYKDLSTGKVVVGTPEPGPTAPGPAGQPQP